MTLKVTLDVWCLKLLNFRSVCASRVASRMADLRTDGWAIHMQQCRSGWFLESMIQSGSHCETPHTAVLLLLLLHQWSTSSAVSASVDSSDAPSTTAGQARHFGPSHATVRRRRRCRNNYSSSSIRRHSSRQRACGSIREKFSYVRPRSARRTKNVANETRLDKSARKTRALTSG